MVKETQPWWAYRTPGHQQLASVSTRCCKTDSCMRSSARQQHIMSGQGKKRWLCFRSSVFCTLSIPIFAPKEMWKDKKKILLGFLCTPESFWIFEYGIHAALSLVSQYDNFFYFIYLSCKNFDWYYRGRYDTAQPYSWYLNVTAKQIHNSHQCQGNNIDTRITCDWLE